MSDDEEPQDVRDAYENALQDLEQGKYLLRLYVAGNTAKSARAILNLRKICEQYLEGRYTLEVIDIYQQPDAARRDQIIATPTLVKHLPLPLRRIIGDMTQIERTLVGLDVLKMED